ncbi:CHC2 zinc finger domain-containing protein [Streptomyces sp. H27-H5]|uniref:CHC2 zinc finger domain-containing protein n=1 Tax=Streptomyces sp. H27-H5 TaxID=2996460 RepID=UPI003B632D6F
MTSPQKPPISKVLARYYGLDVAVTRGRQKVCCPLHADQNPSASVNVDTDRWNCFSCNLSEDSFDVIMREENIGFLEAQEFAHREFGGDRPDVPRDVPGQPGRSLRNSTGFGSSRRPVRTGVRRFGDTWS